MEASGAQGQAGGQGEGGGEAAQEGQQQGGMDFQAVVDQLGSMAQGQEEMRQALAGLPDLLGQQQQQQPGEPEQQFIDPAMLDFENPQFDPNQAAQGLQGWMEQQWQSREQQLLQQHVAPMRQQMEFLQQSQEARDLAAEFPEIVDEDTLPQVTQLAQQFAADLGVPELAGNMKMMRAAYLMGRAMDIHMEELNRQEGPQAAHLEGGGGAGPAGGGQPDLKQQILDASRGSSVLPF